MYPSSICKLCLRICENKCTRVSFSTWCHYFVNRGAVNYRGLENYKSQVWNLPFSKRSQSKKSVFASRITQYSTGNNNLDSVQEHVCKIDDFAEESQRALTVGPPEEFVQSLEEDDQRKLQVLWMEMELFRQMGWAAPRQMSISEWQEAMEKDTRSQKLKFFKHLCIKEARKEKEKLKKIANLQGLEKVRAERELRKAADPSINERDYGLTKNTIFLRVGDDSMNAVYNSWQCQAHQFGQSIVIDLDFDDHMIKKEISNCAEQIQKLYGCNKRNRQPFHLHLCNAHPDSHVVQFLEHFIPNLFSHTCMTTVTKKSYLDIFPKEKLVYLTPHCKNDLVNFDHDAIYIIGGLVDKTFQQPFSMIKAMREGIAMARLPLDHYLEWGDGTKSLALDQMMKIMLDIKNTGCWNTALKNVPRRKLKNGDIITPLVKPRYKYRKSLFTDDD